MSREYNQAMRLLAGIAISSICISIGSTFHTDSVKYISGLAQIYVVINSFLIIRNHRNDFKWVRTRLLFIIISAYPLLRISFDSVANVTNSNTKFLTDGFIGYASYYELAIIGLAIAVLLKKVNGYKLLYGYSLYALPVGIVIMTGTFFIPNPLAKIVLGQSAIINCFIPVALLALRPTERLNTIIGWLGIILILYLSIKIYSRSYSLVGFYFILFGIIAFFKTNQRKLGVRAIVILMLVLFFGASGFFSQKSDIGGDASIKDKYQFNSLGKSLTRFSEDGDIVKLFFWEGNSRSGILVDAFHDFTDWEWMFGRGVFGTYKSFDVRSTIELGWAEELFRWGTIYTLLNIFTTIYARVKIKKEQYFQWNEISRPLYGLILIRLLDGFIYGLPQNSVYNLLFYTGIMIICIYKKAPRKVNVQSSSIYT